MANVFKFPNNGYEVTVLRRQDIIDCIDKNIIDKEVALALVEQCELDAANFISQGKWVSIPYMGNIRVPKTKQLMKGTQQQAMIEQAKQTLDKEQYILFKKNLANENIKQVKHHRYYNYITSIAVNSNKKLYKKLCAEKGEYYARIFLYACKHITALDNEYVNISEYE